jgi:hypothetical protein
MEVNVDVWVSIKFNWACCNVECIGEGQGNEFWNIWDIPNMGG